MKNDRMEDKLARLAFGDLSLEESARLEADARKDPEAARVLAEYRDVRDGLRMLSEVPDHQLSNERLREAVLRQGLRPVRTYSPRWEWAGLGTAVVALVTFLGTRSAAPLAVTKPSAMMVAMRTKPTTSASAVQAATEASGVMPPSDSPGPKLAVADQTVRQERSRKAVAGRTRVARAAEAVSEFDTTPPPVVFERNSPASAGKFEATLVASTSPAPALVGASNPDPLNRSVDASPDSAIVLIQAEQDEDTGAHRAFEVESSHIVVGG